MDKQNFEKILENFENTDLEFKLEVKCQNEQEEKNRIAKTVVAFYNTRGGKIIFGIKEDGKNREVVGLPRPQTTESNFFSQINNRCDIDETPLVEFFKYEDKDVLIITCPKGIRSPYKFKDKIYLRKGSNNIEASEEEIARLYRNRSNDSQDRRIVENSTINELDIDREEKYIETLRSLVDLNFNLIFRITSLAAKRA